MESQAHIDLVNRIYEYMTRLIKEENICLIERDSAGVIGEAYTADSFVPDVYYSFGGTLMIGEAKTENDFERNHSIRQYESYIKECNLFEGDATLIIGIPWQLSATAKNFFRRKKNKKKINFRVIVLDEMGRSYEI